MLPVNTRGKTAMETNEKTTTTLLFTASSIAIGLLSTYLLGPNTHLPKNITLIHIFFI